MDLWNEFAPPPPPPKQPVHSRSCGEVGAEIHVPAAVRAWLHAPPCLRCGLCSLQDLATTLWQSMVQAYR